MGRVYSRAAGDSWEAISRLCRIDTGSSNVLRLPHGLGEICLDDIGTQRADYGLAFHVEQLIPALLGWPGSCLARRIGRLLIRRDGTLQLRATHRAFGPRIAELRAVLLAVTSTGRANR